jgi:hypothetical protein
MSRLSYHFPLIYVYYWATYLWLLTVTVFTNFSSLTLLFISLIHQGLTRVWQLCNHGIVIESMYSYSSGQPFPLHSGFWKKPSIAIPFAAIARFIHISAHQWISTIFVSIISFGWKPACSIGIIVSMLRCHFLFNLVLFVWATIPPTLFNLKKTFHLNHLCSGLEIGTFQCTAM